MADIAIQSLTAATELAGTEIFLGEKTANPDETLQIPLSVLKAYLLGTYVIGGEGATGIMTNQATQTVTNKTFTGNRFNSPKINEDVACTALATDLNKVAGHIAGSADKHDASQITYGASDVDTALDGHFAGSADKHASDDITHTSIWGTDVKAALDGLEAAVGEANPLYLAYQYLVEWTQSGTDPKVITEATMLTACGLRTDAVVMQPVVAIQVWEIDGSMRKPSGTVTYATYDTTTNSQIHMDNISVETLVNTTKYGLSVTFRIAVKAYGGT